MQQRKLNVGDKPIWETSLLQDGEGHQLVVPNVLFLNRSLLILAADIVLIQILLISPPIRVLEHTEEHSQVSTSIVKFRLVVSFNVRLNTLCRMIQIVPGHPHNPV